MSQNFRPQLEAIGFNGLPGQGAIVACPGLFRIHSFAEGASSDNCPMTSRTIVPQAFQPAAEFPNGRHESGGASNSAAGLKACGTVGRRIRRGSGASPQIQFRVYSEQVRVIYRVSRTEGAGQ